MKHIFYDCDECFHSSSHQMQTGAAILKAIEEGFIFVGRGRNRKCYCQFCASKKVIPSSTPDPEDKQSERSDCES